MSHQERRRRLKRARMLCLACEERKARFRYRGRVKADADHTLCFACYRAEVNRAGRGARWWPCSRGAA